MTTLLYGAAVLAGSLVFGMAIGRWLAWNGAGDVLADTTDRRRAMLRVERDTADRFGW